MNDKEIVKLYIKQNMSTYQIAKEVGTYPNKVRRILVKNGVDLKSKSEAQKNALKSGAAVIPTEGRERSEQERLSIGKSMKKYWIDMPEEEMERRREMSRTQWESMSQTEKEEMRSAAHAAMREASSNGSKFEIYIREELMAAGFKVLFHDKRAIGDENLELDMFIPELNAIIEVDGPSHFLPIWGEERLRKQIAADTKKNGLALTNGYIVIRIKTQGDGVCYSDSIKARDTVIAFLNKIKSNPPKNQNERFVEIDL